MSYYLRSIIISTIKRFFKKILQSPAKSSTEGNLKIIPRDQHSISRDNISDDALKVLYRLKKEGFQAFLVGGGVRDLLLGLHPKDFDIATDAHPEEVHKLFSNSRLIGRRFRLVHIYFGYSYVEVATFRAHHSKTVTAQNRNTDGMIVRDNEYGTIVEDAERRDFTINSLYYNIDDFTLRDYTDGLDDLKNKIIRMIGEPELRYREDPVRMLRAIRFCAKLDFTIHPETEKPIYKLGNLLTQISPARMFEELQKLFLTGHSHKVFPLLRKYDLFKYLFPQTEKALAEDPQVEEFLMAVFKNTDNRVNNGKPVTPAFLIAALLWHPTQKLTTQYQETGLKPLGAARQAMDETLAIQSETISVPRRFVYMIREIWTLQHHLPRRLGRGGAMKTVQHPRFRAAYDFMCMRITTKPGLKKLIDWWDTFSKSDDETREDMLLALEQRQDRARNSQQEV